MNFSRIFCKKIWIISNYKFHGDSQCHVKIGYYICNFVRLRKYLINYCGKHINGSKKKCKYKEGKI